VSLKLVTRLTFHAVIFWLKDPLFLNSPSMLVTNDVSQSGISAPYAGPQSTAPVEQQLSPEGTAARHLSTAFFRAAELGNGSAAIVAAKDTPSTRSNVVEGSITNDGLERP
jgi:hypothetical protein